MLSLSIRNNGNNPIFDCLESLDMLVLKDNLIYFWVVNCQIIVVVVQKIVFDSHAIHT